MSSKKSDSAIIARTLRNRVVPLTNQLAKRKPKKRQKKRLPKVNHVLLGM